MNSVYWVMYYPLMAHLNGSTNPAYKHGGAQRGQHTTEYKVWRGVIARGLGRTDCDDYADRGITVCDRWVNGDGTKTGFECFYDDLGPRPDRTSIERVDNDKGYNPTNCTWATASQQARNRRTTRFITVHGCKMSVAEASDIYGVRSGTIIDRLNYGWDETEAATKPINPKRRACGLQTANSRTCHQPDEFN